MSFLDSLVRFHEQSNWRGVLRLNEKSDNKNALKILWVWPSEQNLSFLKTQLKHYDIRGVTSVGCGCGLLEWILQEYTGLPVVGFDVNREWWESKYSAPTFIPLRYAEEEGVVQCNPGFALLFCYFNNGQAFREYVQNYRGAMIIIIGPKDGAGRHTDPRPFNVNFGNDSEWRLIQHQEVKDTRDFIALYLRNGKTEP